MADPFEDVQMERIDDEEFESTVDGTTGAVGGTVAETDFGGGTIQTRAEVHRESQRRGSIPWEGDDLTENDISLTKRLEKRLEDLKFRSGDIATGVPSELNIKQLQDEISANIAERWEETLKKQGYEYKIEDKTQLGTATFRTDSKWTIENDTIYVEYNERKTRLTHKGNPRKFLSLSTIKTSYGRGATSFIKETLGVEDYTSASKKTQQQAEKASTSATTARKKLLVPPELKRVNPFNEIKNVEEETDVLAEQLENDPIADLDEIGIFFNAQEKFTRLSDDYEQLLTRRNKKAKELAIS